MEQLKARQYTYTQISRTLLHMVLDLTAARVQSYKETGRVPYTRIPEFRKGSRELLALVRQEAAILLIIKTADIPHILTGTVLDTFSQGIHVPHIR